MTKYILIDWKKDKNPSEKRFPRIEEDITFEILDSIDDTLFMCGVCFRTFLKRNMYHFGKCRMEWPYEGSKLCKIIKNPKMRIYEIESKSNPTNDKIVRAIERLGELSKAEQGLGLPISTRGLLNLHRFSLFGFYQHFYFILFSYKNIVAYVLLEVYKNLFFGKTKVIIRDVFTFPTYRMKGCSKKILLEISRKYHIKIKDFLFSEPVSEKLKKLLKSLGINSIKLITGRKFETVKLEEL